VEAARPTNWRRYVAVGDSTSEGLMDPYADGRGYRGWADRLAERLGAVEPDMLYANLAVRGKLARQIREEQLDAALALEPDLCTVSGGLNDVLRRHCDLDVVTGHVEAIVAALRAAGATVVFFTYPNRIPSSRVARRAHDRVAAFNAASRAIAARHAAVLVDFEADPVGTDSRLWHPDRLHANSVGHARIADALAHALGLPGAGEVWKAPLPPADRVAPHRALAADAHWAATHLGPWIVRRLRGVSSGDGLTAKRPGLSPVVTPTTRSPTP
jgi:lysophospholipase L1-like esterase